MQYKTPVVAKCNLNKADWAHFQKELSSAEDNKSNIDGPVVAYHSFEQHIITSYSTDKSLLRKTTCSLVGPNL